MIYIHCDFKLISKDNSRTYNPRTRRYYLSSKYRDFEKKVKNYAKKQYKEDVIEHQDLAITILVHFKSKVHSDATNLFKGVNDALQDVVYKNDKQIKKALIIIKNEKWMHDSFEVFIEPYER